MGRRIRPGRACGGSGRPTRRRGSYSATGCGRPPTAGEHWSSVVSPGGSIESLEVIDGQVLALTASCTPDNGCGQTDTLARRPLAGGGWQQVARVTEPGAIATQAKVAAVIDGSRVLITANGGLGTVTQAGPAARPRCRRPPRSRSPAGRAGAGVRRAAPPAACRRRSTSARPRRALAEGGIPGVTAVTRTGSPPGRLPSWWRPRSAGAASSTTRVTAARGGRAPSSRAMAAWASTTSATPPPPTAWSSTGLSSPITTPRAGREAAAHQQRRGQLAEGVLLDRFRSVTAAWRRRLRPSADVLPARPAPASVVLARPGVGDELAGVGDQLREHPGPPDNRHEVGVAAPPGHHVLVQVAAIPAPATVPRFIPRLNPCGADTARSAAIVRSV